MKARAGECAWWVSTKRISQREGETERERERKTRGPKPLVEQWCFNDLSVSMYRLFYKEFLSTMITTRKPTYSNRYQGNKRLTMVITSGDNPYLKKETIHISRKMIETKQFCDKENVS